jgi:hypothetical protein
MTVANERTARQREASKAPFSNKQKQFSVWGPFSKLA